MSPVDTSLGQQLVDCFKIMRAEWVAETDGPLPKFEYIDLSKSDAFFAPGEQPRSVLFISHRWDSPEHPDPTGRKASAIRAFLTHCGRFGSNQHALDNVPSSELLAHGAFQAAHFISRAKVFGEDPASPSHDQVRFDFNRSLLSQVGVWCDYSCLPQEGISEKLKENLTRLDDLINESNLLILRDPADEYETRAWCAVEISAGRRQDGRVHPQNLVLRLDRIGAPIDSATAIERSVSGMFDQEARAQFGTGNLIRMMFERSLPEEEEHEDCETFTIKRPPYIFKGLRDFLIAEIDGLSKLSQFDEIMASWNTADADFFHDMEAMVREWVEKSGLKTTHERDLIYTGLMILFLRRQALPETSRFYSELLHRHLVGKSLKLRRFREIRGLIPKENRCWWLFSDSPPGKGNEPEWMS